MQDSSNFKISSPCPAEPSMLLPGRYLRLTVLAPSTALDQVIPEAFPYRIDGAADNTVLRLPIKQSQLLRTISRTNNLSRADADQPHPSFQREVVKQPERQPHDLLVSID